MASLLQKTRKISTILQEGRHENVDFEAMAMRLSPILDSVVYILDTEVIYLDMIRLLIILMSEWKKLFKIERCQKHT